MEFVKLFAIVAVAFQFALTANSAPDDSSNQNMKFSLGSFNGEQLAKSANDFFNAQLQATNSFSTLMSEMKRASGGAAEKLASSLPNVFNSDSLSSIFNIPSLQQAKEEEFES